MRSQRVNIQASQRPRCGRTRCRAFTLIEVMAAVVVLALIGSIASSTIMTGMDSYLQSATRAQLHTELSITLDRIERELRKITLKSNGDTLAPNITSVTADSIAWGGNSSLTFSSGQVRLVDAGATMALLMEDVSSFVVQTFDESNTPLASSLTGSGCDSIRRISVQITIQRNGVTETLRTKIYVRGTMRGAEV